MGLRPTQPEGLRPTSGASACVSLLSTVQMQSDAQAPSLCSRSAWRTLGLRMLGMWVCSTACSVCIGAFGTVGLDAWPVAPVGGHTGRCSNTHATMLVTFTSNADRSRDACGIRTVRLSVCRACPVPPCAVLYDIYAYARRRDHHRALCAVMGVEPSSEFMLNSRFHEFRTGPESMHDLILGPC